MRKDRGRNGRALKPVVQGMTARSAKLLFAAFRTKVHGGWIAEVCRKCEQRDLWPDKPTFVANGTNDRLGGEADRRDSLTKMLEQTSNKSAWVSLEAHLKVKEK